MPIAWSLLRGTDPAALVAARTLAHRAAQWPARAARANLPPAADDSHTALEWDAERAALVSRPLNEGLRVGLRVAAHELVLVRGAKAESLALAGTPDGEAGRWLDERLAREGLKPTSGAKLPYEVPAALLPRPLEEAPRLAALAGWFAAAAELLESVRARYSRFTPGPGPVRCWPHHFDIAVLVALEPGDPEHAKSIGIGVSPGDDTYGQPYLYVSPYPRPDTGDLPALPPGGRWHTQDFFAAVATGTDLLAQADPGQAFIDIIAAAFDESSRRLNVG
jgi:hypothetical protein